MKEKLAAIALILLLFSCDASRADAKEISSKGTYMNASDITTETKIRDIISNPSLGDWGRLLFPANKGYWSGDTLGDLQLTWYSHINPQKTVEIVRYVTECAENGGRCLFLCTIACILSLETESGGKYASKSFRIRKIIREKRRHNAPNG